MKGVNKETTKKARKAKLTQSRPISQTQAIPLTEISKNRQRDEGMEKLLS